MADRDLLNMTDVELLRDLADGIDNATKAIGTPRDLRTINMRKVVRLRALADRLEAFFKSKRPD